MANNPLKYVDPSGNTMEGNENLSQEIQDEIKWITKLWDQTHQNVKEEIHSVAKKLRDIGKNGDDFAVLRVKTFVPSEKLYLVEHAMEGLGDGRDFSVDATSNRTVQYAVINFSNNELYNFIYTGTSHQTRPIKRADTITNKDMYVSYSLDQGLVKLNAYVSSGNPLVPIANIDYNIKFRINPSKKTYSYEGTTDGFPAKRWGVHIQFVSIVTYGR